MRYFYLKCLPVVLLFCACNSKTSPVDPGDSPAVVEDKKNIPEAIHKTLNVKDFKMYNSASQVNLIDVRTAEEFRGGHLPSAVNIDLNSGFEEGIKSLNPNTPVYVYCQSGKRGETAAAILKDKGFRQVYNLDGGIEAWIEEELEVVSAQ